MYSCAPFWCAKNLPVQKFGMAPCLVHTCSTGAMNKLGVSVILDKLSIIPADANGDKSGQKPTFESCLRLGERLRVSHALLSTSFNGEIPWKQNVSSLKVETLLISSGLLFLEKPPSPSEVKCGSTRVKVSEKWADGLYCKSFLIMQRSFLCKCYSWRRCNHFVPFIIHLKMIDMEIRISIFSLKTDSRAGGMF